MATKTIHSLKYMMTVDSTKFTKGVTAAKSEIAFAKREMKALQTPAEKMGTSLERLGALAKKDSQYQGLYNTKLKQYNSLLKKNARESSTLFKANALLTSGMGKLGIALSAGLVARSMVKQIDRVDRLAKVSDKLGISTENLTRLQFAAGQTVGFSPEQTILAMEEMTVNLNKAEHATGRAKLILDKYNISLKGLNRDTPEETLKEVAKALKKVEDQTDRNVVAGAIFGKQQSGLHVLLSQTTAELDKQFKLSDKLGNTVSTFDASQMVRAKDAIGEMTAAFDSFSRSFATGFAPALTQILGEVTTILNNLPGSKSAASGEVNLNVNRGDVVAAYTRTLGQFLDGNILAIGNSYKNLNDITDARIVAEKKALSRIRTAASDREDSRKAETDAIRKSAQEINAKGLFGAISNGVGGLGVSVSGLANSAISEAVALGKRGQKFLSGIEGQNVMPEMVTELTRQTSGPMDSITAGSSEAFRLTYQTNSIRAVEVEVAKATKAATEKTVSLLEQMVDLARKGEKSEFAGLAH